MNRLRTFPTALLIPSKWRLLAALGAAALLLGLLRVPMLNIPVVLLAFPLFWLVPAFGETGPYALWHFFGPIPQGVVGHLGFYLYYLVVAYLLLFPLGYRTLRRKRAQGA